MATWPTIISPTEREEWLFTDSDRRQSLTVTEQLQLLKKKKSLRGRAICGRRQQISQLPRWLISVVVNVSTVLLLLAAAEEEVSSSPDDDHHHQDQLLLLLKKTKQWSLLLETALEESKIGVWRLTVWRYSRVRHSAMYLFIFLVTTKVDDTAVPRLSVFVCHLGTWEMCTWSKCNRWWRWSSPSAND